MPRKQLTDEEIARLIAGDPDAPEASDEALAKARHFAEDFPVLAEKMRANLGGRPKHEKTKVTVSLRLDPEVVERFKAGGPGWQSRINQALRDAAGLI